MGLKKYKSRVLAQVWFDLEEIAGLSGFFNRIEVINNEIDGKASMGNLYGITRLPAATKLALIEVLHRDKHHKDLFEVYQDMIPFEERE